MKRRFLAVATATLVALAVLVGFGAISIASANPGDYYGPPGPYGPSGYYDSHRHNHGHRYDGSRNPIVNWDVDGMGNVLVVNNDGKPVMAPPPPGGVVRPCFWPNGDFKSWT